jgi:hypothetical protein
LILLIFLDRHLVSVGENFRRASAPQIEPYSDNCWRAELFTLAEGRLRQPEQGVLNIFECWIDEKLFDPRLDFAVRAWARQSADVRKIVDAADETRVEAIREMFARHGYLDPEATVRARVLYFVQIGYYSLEIVEPVSNRLSMVPAYLKTHTGLDPSEAELAAFADFTARVASCQDNSD